MSPRPYRLGQRSAAAAERRGRIIAAAREQLATGGPFTVDAVARRADVARMTVYYQFGSRVGLLEALFDDLAARGGMQDLPGAFRQADPLAALSAFIAAFGHFWASDRTIIRRLQGLATLDAELGEAMRARNERRRNGLRVILARLAAATGRPAGESVDEAVDVLHVLTSFDTYDALADHRRAPEEVAGLVDRLARTALAAYGMLPGR